MKNKKIFVLFLLFVLVFVLLPGSFKLQGKEFASSRKVLLELFTATWCGPCATYGHYADETYDYFGSDKVILLRNQVWQDGLDTPETNARCSFYGVSGVPTLYVNGQYSYHPADYNNYRAKISDLLSKSPKISISLDAQTNSSSQFVSLTVEVKLLESIDTKNLNIVVALYEKQVNYTGSNKVPTHRFVIRDYIFDELGSRINFVNGLAKINLPIMLKKDANPSDFGIAAWVQDMKTLEVLQAESSDIKVTPVITPPVIVMPRDGDNINNPPLLIKWIGSGDSYKLEISDKEDFSNIFFTKETNLNEESIDNLVKEKSYYIRVKSKRGGTESNPSNTVKFTITSIEKPGAKFKNLNTGDLQEGTLNSLVQDPISPDILYAGSYGGGVFKSIDAGKTWTAKNFGLDDLYINSLDIDLNSPKRIFAGTSSGVFVSEDSGDTWLYSGLPFFVRKVEFVPKTNELFALTSEKLYKSADFGKTFELVSPQNLGNINLLGFALNKNNPSTIFFVGYNYNSSSPIVYKTIDGGKTWNQTQTNLDTNVWIYDVAINYSDPSIVFLASSNGVFKSQDGGNTFSKLNTPENYAYSITIDQKNPQRVIIASWKFYISDNSGITWTPLNVDFEVGSPNRLYFDVQNKDKMYVCANNEGFYYSSDGGKSFVKSNAGITAVRVTKTIKTQDITAITTSGTFKISGSYWKKVNNYSFYYADKIKQNPQNLSEIVVMSPIYWSKDGGGTWEYHNLENSTYVYTFDVDFRTMTLYFVYQKDSKWYLGKSDFYGKISESYQIPSTKVNWIYQILVDKDNPLNIYLAVGVMWNSNTRNYEGSGLLKSTNGGKTFEEFAFKEETVSRLFEDSYNTNTLFANAWSGLYKSIDKGLNWKQVSKSTANALGFAKDRKTIYASFGKSFAASEDYGDSWNFIPWDYTISFSRPNIQDILVDRDNPNKVYLSTDGSGEYLYSVQSTPTFNIVSSSYIGGTISPFGTLVADIGSSQTFTITPNTGYKIKDVKVDGVSVGAVSTYTFSNVTSDHTIEASFEAITFTITASAGSGGYISPSGTISVNYGESKTFTITPYSGYKISKVKVDGVSVGAVSTYTFQNVTANHTIEASFEKEMTQIVIVLQVGNSAFTVNGETRYLDSPPIIKNGRTLVPIRAIVEALGGTVQWNPNENGVDIILGSNHLILQVGNPNAYVNGVQKFIDASNIKVYPEIINGRTMLPLRFVAENLGCDVKWDGTTKTITITYTGG